MAGNQVAPKGCVFVCAACGKRSADRYGELAIDSGWDVSCMMNSVLCSEEKNEEGQWVAVDTEPEDA